MQKVNWPGRAARGLAFERKGLAQSEKNREEPRSRVYAGIPNMSDVHHATVHFSGRVQGVGFRYQTLQIARGYEVAGFVRNLPDGRVEVEVEGCATEIDAFIRAIEEGMAGYIRRTDRCDDRRVPQYSGFTIR